MRIRRVSSVNLVIPSIRPLKRSRVFTAIFNLSIFAYVLFLLRKPMKIIVQVTELNAKGNYLENLVSVKI